MTSTFDYLTRIRVGHSNGKPASNKPLLLLSIICEIQAAHLSSNRIAVDDTRLIAHYHDLYEMVTGERDKASPWLPLWHLRNDMGPSGPLWIPEFQPHVATLAGQLGQPKSMGQLWERFTTARLDPTLFKAFQDSRAAWEACSLLVTRYLSSDRDSHEKIQIHLERALESSEYEKHPERLTGNVCEASQQYARSAAFRTLVLEAYDYRCAASRLRYITPDYRYLVEAAHLIPFSVSQDDRPTNGLALTPNLHWALDNHLIAPGPDQRWHVSPAVDALVPDNRWLCELDDTPLVLPRDPRWHPCADALAWRLEHLQR